MRESIKAPPGVVPEPEYKEPLDPKALRLFRDKTNQLRLTIARDRSYLDVKLVYAFPVSTPEGHIGVLDHRERVVGMLDGLEGLDAPSRALAEEALEQRYFIPEVVRIHSLREEFGVVYFDVNTDRGRREFVVRGLRDSLRDLGNGRFQITDADGNRYSIPNWEALETHSRRLIEEFV